MEHDNLFRSARNLFLKYLQRTLGKGIPAVKVRDVITRNMFCGVRIDFYFHFTRQRTCKHICISQLPLVIRLTVFCRIDQNLRFFLQCGNFSFYTGQCLFIVTFFFR